jgi:hypothetical protein
MDSQLWALLVAYVISAVGMLIASGHVLSNWNEVYHKRAKPSRMTLWFATWLMANLSRDPPTKGKRLALWFWALIPPVNIVIFGMLFSQAFYSLMRSAAIELLFGSEEGMRRWRSTALYDTTR